MPRLGCKEDVVGQREHRPRVHCDIVLTSATALIDNASMGRAMENELVYELHRPTVVEKFIFRRRSVEE